MFQQKGRQKASPPTKEEKIQNAILLYLDQQNWILEDNEAK